MSVTLDREPYGLVPAFNEIEFQAGSSETAQPNFNFYVKVTVASTGEIFNYRIKPDGNGKCYFNAKTIAEKFVKSYYPFNVTGWTTVQDGLNTLTINIGEEYGSTPVIYPGTNKSIYIWNASLTLKQRATYRTSQYNATGQWLNSYPTEYNYYAPLVNIDPSHDLTFYFLDIAGSIAKVSVSTLIVDQNPPSSTVVNNFDVDNAAGSGYICVNLSPAAINQLELDSPGACIGSSLPTPFDGTENTYILDFKDASDVILSTLIVGLKPVCRTRDWIFFQNRAGAFDFIDMKLFSTRDHNINRTTYRAPMPRFEASNIISTGPINVDGPNPISRSKKILSSTYESTIVYKNNWLTQQESDAAGDAFSSAFVHVQHGYGDYTLLSPEDNRYTFKREMSDKNIEITLTTTTAHQEGRQFE